MPINIKPETRHMILFFVDKILDNDGRLSQFQFDCAVDEYSRLHNYTCRRMKQMISLYTNRYHIFVNGQKLNSNARLELVQNWEYQLKKYKVK